MSQCICVCVYVCVYIYIYIYICMYLKSLCYIPKAYTLSYVNYSSKKRVGAWQRVGNKGKKANNTQGTEAGTPESWEERQMVSPAQTHRDGSEMRWGPPVSRF